ncbi:MAG: tetratricopeptide repeat protein, partial [Deltaproteobacteria bacterium]|nr:tetratricopeptide repeat protein [Deltaproteobacteria bacterium]
MNSWKITGSIATLVIILSIPLYLLKMAPVTPHSDSLQKAQVADFVGSRKCMDCHKSEYDKWQNSHHDHAMDVAGDKTVLGDFNNTVFEIHGVTSRFYRNDGKFFVHTRGPDGQMGEFEITHTFGWFPLQQYLVPFPGGRLQCLPIAWDVKEKRWYHLSPDEPVDPKDWLYWTNAGQNWNGMCAECHSTNLKKNYNIQKDTYETTWSEIDVGCEACHGPGSEHVKWSELPDMARPPVENYDLLVKTSGLGSRELVELCAPCHARRAILADYTHAEPDLLDSLLPSLLTPELYFPDGQILDEVYVYGSFTQSKMYHRDVRCSDCHEVHSTKLIKDGNDLCLQCHRNDEYNTKEHHFHKNKGAQGEPIRSANGGILFDVGSGAECIQCHMPGRYYMGIDYRPDHGFRIPRPDLSIKLSTPNACNRCHFDKTNKWSDEHITKWYGPGRRRHYSTIIQAGRNGIPGARKDLIRLATDPLYPVIVRATALSLLTAYPGEETSGAYERALLDEEALIRRTAANSLNLSDISRQIKFISPLLYDPVKAVRIEAASKLAGEPSKHLDTARKKVFQMTLEEYVTSMQYSGDFAFGRYNLGNLYSELRRTEDAIRNYRAAIKIDDLFYPAKVNLAMHYNQLGEKDRAEQLLREVVTVLGLLLSEKEQYGEAVIYLEKASKGMSKHARVHYNLGLLLQHLKRDAEAEMALLKALELEQENMDYMYALADYYLKREKFTRAKQIAEEMIKKYPTHHIG